LADLAVALQANDQTHTIRKLFKILVESKPLGSPVFTAVMTETLKRGMDAITTSSRAG
jgi:hypothetical protein